MRGLVPHTQSWPVRVSRSVRGVVSILFMLCAVLLATVAALTFGFGAWLDPDVEE